jgi:RNA recognition motif-containing protein
LKITRTFNLFKLNIQLSILFLPGMQDHKNQIMQNQQQESKNLLVISDLADNVTDNDLKMFFEAFEDKLVLIQLNKSQNQFQGNRMNSATLVFRENKDADKARIDLNMRKLKGRTVRITWHERDSTLRYQTHLNLYIKNVPVQVTPRQFYEHFLKFGVDIGCKKIINGSFLFARKT